MRRLAAQPLDAEPLGQAGGGVDVARRAQVGEVADVPRLGRDAQVVQAVDVTNTDHGILVSYVCWCGSEQTWLTGSTGRADQPALAAA